MNPIEFLQQNWFLVAVAVAVLLMMRDPNNPISKALGLGRTSPKPQQGFTPAQRVQPHPQPLAPPGWPLPPNAQVGQVFQLGPGGLVPVQAPPAPEPAPVARAAAQSPVVIEEIPAADLDEEDGSMELEFVPTGIRLVDRKRGLKLKFTTANVGVQPDQVASDSSPIPS